MSHLRDYHGNVTPLQEDIYLQFVPVRKKGWFISDLQSRTYNFLFKIKHFWRELFIKGDFIPTLAGEAINDNVINVHLHTFGLAIINKLGH